MSSFFELMLLLLGLFLINVLGYFYPSLMIRFRGRKAVFSKYNKYNIFSDTNTKEFEVDVKAFKERRKLFMILLGAIMVFFIVAPMIWK